MYESYEDLPKLKLPLGQEVFISDTTLRDGAQMPGVVVKKEHKLRIYEYLHKIGIEKLECFLYTKRDKEVARQMLNVGYEVPEVTAWSRAREEDIDLVLQMDGIRETGILMSISDSHIYQKLGFRSREGAKDHYLGVLDYALDHGLRVRCHLEDITRSDFRGFVLPFVKEILERGEEIIIRICDTVGYGVFFPEVEPPFGIPKLIQELRGAGAKNIETHIHDDFGFGTTLSLAGFWYGANWSSLTFLGIGERAGNAELEKVLTFLCLRVEGFEKYNIGVLTEFARFMEVAGIIRVPPNKAIVGRNVFAHESGIHTAAVLKNPFLYEPFPPELVGGERKLLVGDSSGRDVIRHKVEELVGEMLGTKVKISKDDPRIRAIYKRIHRLYDEGRTSCISDEEMREYVRKFFLGVR